MDENEDFQHLEEMIANLQVKQKQILKGMLDYPIQIDSAIRILSDPSRQLATTPNNITGSSLLFMLNQQTRCQDNILLTQKF
jgi:hypothetical protein